MLCKCGGHRTHSALRLVTRLTGGGIGGAHHMTTLGPGVSQAMFPDVNFEFFETYAKIFILCRWSEEGGCTHIPVCQDYDIALLGGTLTWDLCTGFGIRNKYMCNN